MEQVYGIFFRSNHKDAQDSTIQVGKYRRRLRKIEENGFRLPKFGNVDAPFRNFHRWKVDGYYIQGETALSRQGEIDAVPFLAMRTILMPGVYGTRRLLVTATMLFRRNTVVATEAHRRQCQLQARKENGGD